MPEPGNIEGFLNGLETANIRREMIIEQLEIRLSQLLQLNAEQFFQLMYRLDIPESKLKEALEDKTAPLHSLAEIVYERQTGKMESRRLFGRNDDSMDNDLSW